MATDEDPATWRNEPVRITPYDARWPALFEAEAELIRRAIAPWITGGIHHVGSTAVPGLGAKPIIDIAVGVESLDSSRPCIEALKTLQYLYSPYRADQMHWFCKPDPAHRTHHLHLIPTGSERLLDELAFRDHLRAHPDSAAAYQALKKRLATEYAADREAYTRFKAPFVEEIIARSRTSAPDDPS